MGPVDVAEPGRALTSDLTVPVLRALVGRSSLTTAAQIWRVSASGTYAGVQRVLERLARHGLCVTDRIGDRTVYRLNRDHLLYPAVIALLSASGELRERIRRALESWNPAPVTAILFGSAARQDGDLDSDIDLLLVYPASTAVVTPDQWEDNVLTLRRDIETWTGNRLQIVERSRSGVLALAAAHEPLLDEVARDGITLMGASLSSIIEDGE